MWQQNMYHGGVFSLRKEGNSSFLNWSIVDLQYYVRKWNSDTCFNMDEPWRLYAKWNKAVRKGQILYESTYISFPEQSNS